MSRQHLGIIITVIGTILLAFSVRIERAYIGKIAKDVDKMKKANPNLLEPTETTIIRPLFWIGLILIAFGSILQW